MPDGRLFHYSIVTPEKVQTEGRAEFLTLPGLDGEFGILYNRSPLVVRLSPGLVRIRADGRERWYFVAGGFAQVFQNDITILTPRSAARQDIQPGDAEAARARARATVAPDAAGQRKLIDAYAEVHALDRLTTRADV